jgi:hypothetical protein
MRGRLLAVYPASACDGWIGTPLALPYPGTPLIPGREGAATMPETVIPAQAGIHKASGVHEVTLKRAPHGFSLARE